MLNFQSLSPTTTRRPDRQWVPTYAIEWFFHRGREGRAYSDATGRRNYPKTVNEDNWARLFRRLSDQCGFSPDQVDQLLFTQISKSSIEVAAERCNVPVEKCHMIMQKYGYTGSACIPMAFDDAIELGKIKRGDQAAAAIRMTV